ncbi:hypothetical protein [Pukyongiella litopenaei]|uniref:Pilus assembly protein PilP n=1 Tax=Pukyongiella litopenaei TaxID=2605946 RepID=A0A2S0MMH6_9RHOB|nr:hypothetical protein [Pukyongiella litopenaei]AVO37079.1 hypothetical protein C6Y53_04730 [Pukyongiella litopenaei]
MANATPSNVAAMATKKKIVDRNETVLIGLFGPTTRMEALMRLPGGRIRTVKNGTSILSGRVVAIDERGVHLLRRGEVVLIGMPGT